MVCPEPIDYTLDCTGLYCPQAVIRTAAQAQKMKPGQILTVVGDDPGMQIDIPAWSIGHGHEYLGVEICDGQIRCYLRLVSA